MKLLHLLSAFLMMAAISCKNKPSGANPETGPQADSSEKLISYLPVSHLIREDIKRVDSFAAGILKKTEANGKKDSVYIKPAELAQLAQPFLDKALDSADFRKNFSEESLMDETTEMINFIYTSRDTTGTQPLKKVIAYIKPAPTVTKVSRFYMEKEFMEGDVFVHQKLTWNTDQYFYTLTIRQTPDGKSSTSMEKVIWNPELFGE